ncbi:MAG: hypothetical protein ACLR1R_13230 [Ruminococcus callidus]
MWQQISVWTAEPQIPLHWTSGKTDAILSKLPDGKYTLKETGDAFTDAETKKTYTVIESTMTFTVGKRCCHRHHR